MLAASVDDEQVGPVLILKRNFILFFIYMKLLKLLPFSQSDVELSEPKQNAKMVIRRLNRNSEPQASIEAGQYTLQWDLLSNSHL